MTDAAEGLTLADHPRAASSIARIRSRFALGAALVAGFLANGTGAGADGVVLRALLVGLAGYLVGWAVALTVWREIVRAEFRAAVRRRAGH